MKKGLFIFALFCALIPFASAEEIPYLPTSGEVFPSDLDLSLGAVDQVIDSMPLILPAKNPAIHVDIPSQRMCIEAYGNTCAKEYPVSTGASDTPTPTGDFQIYFKQELRVAGGETPYRMPYYMAFADNGEYGLHSLPYLGNTTTGSGLWFEARGHIGIPVSHGCVRLLPEDVEKLFYFIPDGTPLYIR